MSAAVALKEISQPFYEELGRSIALARGTVSGLRHGLGIHTCRVNICFLHLYQVWHYTAT